MLDPDELLDRLEERLRFSPHGRTALRNASGL